MLYVRLHPGKAKSYKPKALRGERKVSLFHTPSTGPRKLQPPFQPKRKNGDVRKKRDPHQEQEKLNKRKKNRRKVKRKQIN